MALGRGADCGRPGAPARALPRTAADCGRTMPAEAWPEKTLRFRFVRKEKTADWTYSVPRNSYFLQRESVFVTGRLCGQGLG